MKKKVYSCKTIGEITEKTPEEIYYSSTADSIFFSAKKYPLLYNEHLPRFREHPEWISYGQPFEDVPKKIYRGTDREGVCTIDETKKSLTAKQRNIYEYYKKYDCFEPICQDEESAITLLSAFKNADEYEILWARLYGAENAVPEGYRFLGYDISYFIEFNGAFSIICDCMFICRWHGCDEGGTHFSKDFARLNDNGLFSQWQHAYDYMMKYLHEDWAEIGEYGIYEIYSRQE